MPRKKRFQLLGVPPHSIQRGNNREPAFLRMLVISIIWRPCVLQRISTDAESTLMY